LNFAPENDLVIKVINQQFNSKMESGYQASDVNIKPF